MFANLEAAYDALSDETKARIEGLECHHKVTVTQNAAKRFTEDEFQAMVNGDPVRHPLAGRHPVSGRRFLFVNVPLYCRSIVGMEHQGGDALLSELYQHAGRPEFHFRLTWAEHTVVVWENPTACTIRCPITIRTSVCCGGGRPSRRGGDGHGCCVTQAQGCVPVGCG